MTPKPITGNTADYPADYTDGFNDGLSYAHKKLEEMTKQRDELLVALKSIIKDDSHNPSLMVMIAQEALDNMSAAEDAIASVKGGAA